MVASVADVKRWRKRAEHVPLQRSREDSFVRSMQTQSELHSSDERICYPDLPYCPDRKAAEMIAAEGRKTPQSGLMGDNQNSPWGVSIVAHQACVIHHHRMLDMLS